MISNATKRSILRWIHIVFSIPILGYIYGEPSEVQQCAAAVRFFFFPVIVLYANPSDPGCPGDVRRGFDRPTG